MRTSFSTLLVVLAASCASPHRPAVHRADVLASRGALRWIDVTSGERHSCGLRSDGSVHCWGANNSSQLGEGEAAASGVPVHIQGIGPATAIFAGANHTCAVLRDGHVACWGANEVGQLGQGTVSAGHGPVTIEGLDDVVSGAAGRSHSCAVHANGTVSCWGASVTGAASRSIGRAFRRTPGAVPGLENVVGLVAGADVTCATRRDGTVLCAGPDDFAQLGDGARRDPDAFVALVEPSRFREIATDGLSSCGVGNAGNVACWGRALTIGPRSNDAVLAPEGIPGLTEVAHVRMGYRHACVEHTNGSIHCWGDPFQFAPDDTDAGSRTRLGFAVERLALGERHRCAIARDGTLACWGDNAFGQLGDGSVLQSSRPVRVEGVEAAALLAVHERGTCVRDTQGAVRCWGRAAPASEERTASADAVVTEEPSQRGASALAFGGAHECVLGSDHTVVCDAAWDDAPPATVCNTFGDVRNCRRPNVPPTRVRNVVQVVTGAASTCVRRTDGDVLCWGANSDGEVGDGTRVIRRQPVVVRGAAHARDITAGERHACVVRADATVRCWGSNASGQLGVPLSTEWSGGGVDPGVRDAAQVVAGAAFSCARTNDGAVWCWGSNASGQLGDGTETSRPEPRLVSDLRDAVSIAAGPNGVCAIRRGGLVACWGANESREFGGQERHQTTPRNVEGLAAVEEVGVADGVICTRSHDASVRCLGTNRDQRLGVPWRLSSDRPLVVRARE